VANRFLVLTEFKAVDGMTRSMNSMNKGFSRFAMRITDTNDILGRSFSNVNKSINRVVMAGMAAMAVGLGIATSEFIKLDNSITAAGAKFDDIDSRAKDFRKNLDALRQAARAVGATTEFSATDAAGALDAMSAAGYKSTEAIALLAGTADFATASGESLANSVDKVVDVLSAFGLKQKANSPEELAKSMQRASDVMAKTAAASTVGLNEIYESVKAGAAVFTSTGQDIETFNALVGVLGNNAIKGEQAGTALRNVMLRLANPTGDAAKIMDQLGIKTADQNGNFLDIIDIMGQFETAMQGYGNAERAAALDTIFGAHAIAAVNILMGEGKDKVNDFRDALYDASGEANRMAAAMRGSLGNQLKVLKNSAIELGLKIVEAFEKDGSNAIQKLIEIIGKIDPKPIVDFLKYAVSFFGFVAKHWKIILALAAGIKAVSIAMGILSVVTQVFGITLAATPIGWIIAAVAALAIGIVLLITHFEEVKAVVKSVGSFMMDFFVKPVIMMGQVLLKYLLMPINLVIDGILTMMNMAAKVTGSDKLAAAAKSMAETKARLNESLTGAAGTFDFGGTIEKGGNVFSGAQTPAPAASSSRGGMPGQYDIYLHGAPAGTTGKETKPAQGVKVKFDPVLQ
jgi:TP901 family phage tail tape measure protein